MDNLKTSTNHCYQHRSLFTDTIQLSKTFSKLKIFYSNYSYRLTFLLLFLLALKLSFVVAVIEFKIQIN